MATTLLHCSTHKQIPLGCSSSKRNGVSSSIRLESASYSEYPLGCPAAQREPRQEYSHHNATVRNEVTLMRGPASCAYPCVAYVAEKRNGATAYFCTVRRSRNAFFKFWRWPPSDWYSPGGILDAQGRHFGVIGLYDWTPRPSWLGSFADEFIGGMLFRLMHPNFGLNLANATQLSLSAFKERVEEIVYGVEPRSAVQIKDRERTIQRLASITTFEEVVMFVDWFQRTDGGTVI